MAEVRRRGPGGNGNGETSGTFQDALDGAGACPPIVIVHTVDHECRKFRTGGGGVGKRERSCHQQSESHRLGTRSFDNNRSQQIWWGGRPRPRGSPWTRCLPSSTISLRQIEDQHFRVRVEPLEPHRGLAGDGPAVAGGPGLTVYLNRAA